MKSSQQFEQVNKMPRHAPGAKIAVVISCFNYDQYVDLAINSVRSQNCPDCELVIVDDGSTDESWDVIKQSGAKAVRISNGGQRGACFHGFKLTEAPFVLFLDADDELLPGSLEKILRNLDENVSKLQFPLRRVDRDGNVISGPVPPLTAYRGGGLMKRVLKSGVYPSPPTSGNVFRRDVCELLEHADYDNAVDGVILFAAPFMGDVVSLSEELGLYRVHDRNKSGVGNLLNPTSFQRDLQRFVNRMNHLRRVLEKYGHEADLVAPKKAYFYRERRLYLAIASDERRSAIEVAVLLFGMWGDYQPVRDKVTMTFFFVMISLLPNERARRGLAYRLQAGTRSTLGFVRAIL